LRQSTFWRTLLASTVALSLAAQAAARPNTGHADTSSSAAAGGTPVSSRIHAGGLSPAEVQRLAQNANQRVVVILRDQHPNLPPRGNLRAARTQAISNDQSAIVAELQQVHAPRLHAFHLINVVAATVSSAEEARLKADPAVQAVVPDRVIALPKQPAPPAAPSTIQPTSVLSDCTFSPILEPEALQLTNTAFKDPSVPQAQSVVSGTGVTVAFIAEGLDINNPDFIRPDGSHVFVDYKDFSGDGTNAPTGGGEAFGDASSIAAQGNETYNVNDFVNNAHRRSDACPQIKVLGMAPGASLIDLKVFGNTIPAYDSVVAQAVEYAVDHGVNVLSESLGSNVYPDNNNDPFTLANDAAVAAGITVVASSGDAGTSGTVGTPATDPNVIAAGATTQFRFYQETTYSGFQLGNGGYEGSACDTDPTGCREGNNISAFSSAGVTANNRKSVDVVAPGDLSWEVCTPDPILYSNCTDFNGQPSRIASFGGTSESAPLTAGEAALVIQAYRQSHGGVTPSPALVKQIIMSTATDLNIPGYEQGAGLINSLKAVQAARSYQDQNSDSSVQPQGDALLASPGTLSATDAPGATQNFSVEVTNSGATAQTVQPRLRTLGAPTNSQSFTANLNPTAAATPTFIDSYGRKRAYVEQDFTIAAADRLDAAIAWNVTRQQLTIVRLELVDPQGRYTAYTIPQDFGSPFTSSGYGHVDVRNPQAGTWKAFIWTAAGAAGYSGPVKLDVSTSNFVPLAGGMVSPATQMVAPGQTARFTVSAPTPASPGDQNADLVISGTSATGSVVPIYLRALVPTPASGSSTVFTGTLTGGNGRYGAADQQTYAFNVPAGQKDLDLGLSITDTSYNLEGILVTPDGLPIDVQSTVTATNPITTSPMYGQPTGYTTTMQFFRRDPQPGQWRFLLLINNNVSGRQTSLPFTATLRFNGVKVDATGVPNDASVTLPQSATVSVPITVTNTGNTTKDFFVDPRLAQTTQLSLGGYTTPFPPPANAFLAFFVPSESDQLSVATETFSPTEPVNLELVNANGAPPYGFTGSPDIQGNSFLDPFTGNQAVVATSRASEVVPGYWQAIVTPFGPYPATGIDPSTEGTAATAAIVDTQQFDPAADSSTGDLYALFTGQPSSPYTPLTLAPGQTGTITVTLTPNATVGSVISGTLYVDTFSFITTSGDELVGIPYKYTVGAASMPAGTATVSDTATVSPTAIVSGTATVSPTAIVSGTATVSPTAIVSGTATVSPTAIVSGTATVSPTAIVSSTATVSATMTGTTTPPTATGTAVPATSTSTNVPDTATSTNVPATSTSTNVPDTATSTNVPATSTSTNVPATDTGIAVPATSTDTAVPATSTSTNVPATATETAVPATATATPSTAGGSGPVCQLFALPAFDTVPRGGDQALVFVAAPDSAITATIRADYPVSATLYTDSSLDGSDGFGTTLTGKHVRAGYRYAFHVQASGFALLTFAIPRDAAAPHTVATRVEAAEPCGLFQTSVTFEVRGGGATALATGRAVTLAMTLPQGDMLPTSAGRLVHHGVVRVLTHKQGHGRAARTTRTLLLTYHPRTAHPHARVTHPAAHKAGTARTHTRPHVLFGIYG